MTQAVRELALPVHRLAQLKTVVAEVTISSMEHGNQLRSELSIDLQVLVSDTALMVRISDRSGGIDIPGPVVPDLNAKLAEFQSSQGSGFAPAGGYGR